MSRRLVVFLLAMSFVPITLARVDEGLARMGPEPDVSSVWTGPVVRAFSMGFADTLADLYWLRAVQYYGRQKTAEPPSGFADLAPLLDTAAELDPRFELVYRYGSVFLSEQVPIGAGQPSVGVAFLKKGADRNPTNWSLRKDQGFYTFVYLNDAVAGAAILREASEIPGAAPWLKPLAAKVLSDGGNLEASLRMWTLIRDQTEPGVLRENALAQLDVVRNRIFARDIQSLVYNYRNRTGDVVSTLEQLRARGVIPSSRDLADVPFEFNVTTGTLEISSRSPLWRRPTGR